MINCRKIRVNRKVPSGRYRSVYTMYNNDFYVAYGWGLTEESQLYKFNKKK